MKDCVFCKIVSGEIPANKVYEDDSYLAFLDIEQGTKGKTLVIPKKHYRWTFDIPRFGEYFEIVKKIAKASEKAMEAKWVNVFTWGMDVPHAHVHVNPRYTFNERPGKERSNKFSNEQMKKMAEEIKKAMKQ